MHEAAERRPVDIAVPEEPLEVGRHAERRRRSQGGDRGGRPGDVERAGQQHLSAGQQGVDREAQGRAVVQRGEHQVPVAGPEVPERDLLGRQRAGVVLGKHAGPDTLAPARRPGRVVHRAGQWHVGEVDLGGSGQQPGRFGADVQGRVGVLRQRRPLGRRQAGIGDHGHDPGPQGAEDDGQQGGRGGRRHQQPVARAESGSGQRGRRTALVALAVGRGEDRHVPHAGRTVSPVEVSTRPSACSFARVARVDCVAAGHSCRGTSA